jgi:hypothetical protein
MTRVGPRGLLTLHPIPSLSPVLACAQFGALMGNELAQLSTMLDESTKLEEEIEEKKRVQSMGPGDIGPPKQKAVEP